MLFEGLMGFPVAISTVHYETHCESHVLLFTNGHRHARICVSKQHLCEIHYAPRLRGQTLRLPGQTLRLPSQTPLTARLHRCTSSQGCLGCLDPSPDGDLRPGSCSQAAPGGPSRIQEDPGGPSRSQAGRGRARRTQEDPGGPEGRRRIQVEPRQHRSTQDDLGSDPGPQGQAQTVCEALG